MHVGQEVTEGPFPGSPPGPPPPPGPHEPKRLIRPGDVAPHDYARALLTTGVGGYRGVWPAGQRRLYRWPGAQS